MAFSVANVFFAEPPARGGYRLTIAVARYPLPFAAGLEAILLTNKPKLMRILILIVLSLVPYAASAQKGTVRYDHTYSVLYHPFLAFDEFFKSATNSEFEPPPAHITATRNLVFDASNSLMYRTSGPVLDVQPKDRRVRDGIEHIDTTYVNFEDDTFIESRAFAGNLYLVKGEQPVIPWRFDNEERLYLGYRVMKATAELDSAYVEAWFTPEIPIPAGPGMYGGLPGLILMVTNASEGEVYAADSLTLDVLSKTIVAPTRGRAISDGKYQRFRANELAKDQRFWDEARREIEEGRASAHKSDLSTSEILRRANQGRGNY